MEEYFEIGQIVNTSGLKGVMKVKPFTDDITKFSNLKTIYVSIKKELKEFEIEQARFSKNMVFLKLKGIDTVEKANEFLRDEFLDLYQKWFPVEPKSKETKFVKADINEVNSILKATFPGHIDKSGVFLLKGYKFFCPEITNQKILIHLNEKEGLWITDIKKSKKYSVKLVETDTTGLMPEVMKDLIDRTFLKNAKPKFREVYIDIDEIILSQVKPKRTA